MQRCNFSSQILLLAKKKKSPVQINLLLDSKICPFPMFIQPGSVPPKTHKKLVEWRKGLGRAGPLCVCLYGPVQIID